jgi:phage N-6-adenine-methyltransferase
VKPATAGYPREAALPPEEDRDDRTTLPSLFGPLNDRFGFTVDAAASARNARCARYWTILDDGLTQPWAEETVWCNPPYSDIESWVSKGWSEYPTSRGIVMLLPANRTDQPWWQRLVEPYRDRPGSPLTVEFLPGRLRFLKPGRTKIGPGERPPFGCCLLIWSSPIPVGLALQPTLGSA